MSFSKRDLERILPKVEKPGRYVGGEINQIVKDPAQIAVRCALIFPDQYDIGMSYHGFRILYERVNARPQWWAERVFCPWLDMEEHMRREEVPLWALESKDPLAVFDVLGYSLQHELNYTNILNSLDLSGLSPWSSHRQSLFPLVIAGGEGALAPETLAPFIDVFALGDGEEVLEDILLAVEEFKRDVVAQGRALESLYPQNPIRPGAGIDDPRDGMTADCNIEIPNALKRRLLRLIAGIPGCYVPAFVSFEWNQDGTLAAIRPKEDGIPAFVKKRQFAVGGDLGPLNPVIPNVRVVHDRVAIEIKRGCNVGCRFCSAGMINRPLRERTPEQILEIARQSVENTGYREIGLMSLSSADFTALPTTIRLLQEEFGCDKMGVSLPSLRINAFDVEIADMIARGPRSGFTFAPEAGSERLRRVINKPVDEERFKNTVTQVLERGWRTLKFYYMIGLPTETDEDLDGIVEMTRYAEKEGRRVHGRSFSLAVSLSPFVPKPHTPFQWHGQPPMEELARRVDYVKGRLRPSRQVQLRYHDFAASFVEAIMARGDRRVARALHRAWQLGTRFDSWGEGFRFEAWMQACKDVGLDPEFYANRNRGQYEMFPFDHTDPSLGKQFLWREFSKSQLERRTPDCALVRCAQCDVCDDSIDNILAVHESRLKQDIARDNDHLGTGPKPADPERAGDIVHRAQPLRDDPENRAVQRVRVKYTKTGDLRWLAHLDMIRLVEMAVLRTGLPVSFSEGYSPAPRISWGPPLGVGVAGEGEYFEIQFHDRVDPAEVLERLRPMNSPGLSYLETEEVPLHGRSISDLALTGDYRIELPGTDDLGLLREQLKAFDARETFLIQFERKGKMRARNLKQAILELKLDEEATDSNGTVLRARVSLVPGEYHSVGKALAAILPDFVADPLVVLTTRESMTLAEVPSAAI